MFGSQILGVATGLVLVYIVFALILTSCREILEARLKTRSTTLLQGLEEIFAGAGARKRVEEFYDHPLIASLYRGTSFSTAKAARELPSYIPAGNFSSAVLSIYRTSNAAVLKIDALREDAVAALEKEPEDRVARALLHAIDAADGELDRVQKELEVWYDSVMDRVSGWYKRHTQNVLFASALAIAVLLNVNSVTIAQALYSDDALQERTLALALQLQSSEAAQAAAAGTPAARASQSKTEPKQDVARSDPSGAGANSVEAADAAAPEEQAVAEQSTTKGDEASAPCGDSSDVAAFNTCVREWDSLLRSSGLPIGWNELGRARAKGFLGCPNLHQCAVATSLGAALASLYGILLLLVGYVATAAALTLGAPFWFDVLNKIMVIRSTVKPFEKSGPEGSEDRPVGRRLEPLRLEVSAAPAGLQSAGTKS
jgi:hypothetical protein